MEPKRVKIEDIQRAVARHYNVSRADMLSSRRTANVVRPRQIAMYLAKTLTLRSLPEIGRRFGGRDHTTVLHAVRKIENLGGQRQGAGRGDRNPQAHADGVGGATPPRTSASAPRPRQNGPDKQLRKGPYKPLRRIAAFPRHLALPGFPPQRPAPPAGGRGVVVAPSGVRGRT